MKKVLPLLLLAFILSGCGLVGIGDNSDNGANNGTASEFVLEGIDGETWQLSDLEGSVVVLYFWSASCPPCVYRLPDLEVLSGEMPPDSYLLLVNLNDSRERIQGLTEGYENMNLLVNGFSLFHEYGLRFTPSTVIFDRQGNMVDKFAGFPPNQEVLDTVNKIE